jgi:hypothetical protein
MHEVKSELPKAGEQPVEPIAGEVGFIATKYSLSKEATAEIYNMFCGQAQRWGEKVTQCETRIINQRAQLREKDAVIERLKAQESHDQDIKLQYYREIERLRKALKEIADHRLQHPWGSTSQIAKKALSSTAPVYAPIQVDE